MSQPTSQDVHLDAILTNISTAYIQDSADFIAGKVFPMIPVDKQSNVYYTYTKNDWFRDEAQPRSDGSESAGSGYNLGTDSYFAKVYAFHKDIGDKTRANADNPLSLDNEATMFVMRRMLMRQEIQWATDYFTTSVWGTDLTPSNLWSDYAASDPIQDMKTARITIRQNTGMRPNTLVLGYQVFESLKDHPDIVDRMKYTNSDVITPEIMARFFEVDRIHIAGAVKATNLEGETAAYSFVHGKHALLCHVASAPGLLTPSAGYTFVWTGVSSGLGEMSAVSRIRMEHLKSDRIEAEMAFVNKAVGTDLGYFFNGAVA